MNTKILSLLNNVNSDNYIPSCKIYFELENKIPKIFCQNSSLNKNELSYIIQNKYNKKSEENNLDELNINPALYILLLDQSYSMIDNAMKLAIKALILFLQSVPSSSFYQIIGFGFEYIKYDETPKEYSKVNIKKSISFAETLTANLGGTDIFIPLNDIYSSYEIYDKIKLPKNIFLLTDGYITNKKKNFGND